MEELVIRDTADKFTIGAGFQSMVVSQGAQRLQVDAAQYEVTVKQYATPPPAETPSVQQNLFVGVSSMPNVTYPALALKDIGNGTLEFWVTDGT